MNFVAPYFKNITFAINASSKTFIPTFSLYEFSMSLCLTVRHLFSPEGCTRGLESSLGSLQLLPLAPLSFHTYILAKCITDVKC